MLGLVGFWPTPFMPCEPLARGLGEGTPLVTIDTNATELSPLTLVRSRRRSKATYGTFLRCATLEQQQARSAVSMCKDGERERHTPELRGKIHKQPVLYDTAATMHPVVHVDSGTSGTIATYCPNYSRPLVDCRCSRSSMSNAPAEHAFIFATTDAFTLKTVERELWALLSTNLLYMS